MWHENYDLEAIKTPVDVKELQFLLKKADYSNSKTSFLVSGFENGFSLQFSGNRKVQRVSPNLKFTIGDRTELWNKVMKEVKEGRYAGPFRKPPFKHFIQSPIGLVPKDNGTKTRLIFHLSYPKNQPKKSVNGNTPKSFCTVKYSDFDQAVRLCIKKGQGCFVSKTDLISAFRQLPIRKRDWNLLVMKASCPLDNTWYYFVDKCLPFGHSISCALFQELSNAISFLAEYKNGEQNVNYLDDFLFAETQRGMCNHHMNNFVDICNQIRLPVSPEKTVEASTTMTFLGLLINTDLQLVCIPLEKLSKICNLLRDVVKRKKLTLKTLQSLCGHLNFICRAVIPGRAFTRRLYMALEGKTKLKPHHHINVSRTMRLDLTMWLEFLTDSTSYARPFLNFGLIQNADELNWFTDAAKGEDKGCGGICDNKWFAIQWQEGFIKKYDPSIAFLELYGVVVSVLNWLEDFSDHRIVLFCDNESVVHMINQNTSSCKFCLALIRILVLESLKFNTRIFAKHVSGFSNNLADMLSRGKIDQFRRLTKNRFRQQNDGVDVRLWPVEKILKQA